MPPNPRQSHLTELGLTLWRQRFDYSATNFRDEKTTSLQADSPAPEPQSYTPPETVIDEARVAESGPLEISFDNSDIALMDWDALHAALAREDHRGATQPVFGVGARDAPLLIIGEAPGAEEDRRGEPFVGRAGKLLDRMLFAIGHDRQRNTYIANICKFRPPDNRDPTADEVAADRPYLERQIALISPKLIVAVGRVAAQTLLGSAENLGKLRGRLHKYPGSDIPVLVTYHPAYLLRSPQQKGKSWDDLKQVISLLGENGQ